jgi:hypothetical protein
MGFPRSKLADILIGVDAIYLLWQYANISEVKNARNQF